ncbi:MAG: hypothetical protein CSA72_01805 [Rhodobacterales bacterium]|nr:MAG: hypothetical protein CSA72_01805 [Rhodobacterales bacterium]
MIRLILLLMLLPLSASARDFASWLEADLWPAARAAGVSRSTFDGALRGVAPDWSLPGVARPGTTPPRAQHQAEFGAPARYFRHVTSSARTGRDMAARHASALRRAEAATGVPGHIVLAIWGRESAYGAAALPHDAVQVLATNSFAGGPRAAYFKDELVAALRIIEAGHAAPRGLRSSWAGALGQPQFMPSSFLEHAVDGTGDGRADIWGSDTDTIASIASFLAHHGWVKGRDWGFEVRVPASVSCSLEGPDQGRAIRDWEAMGITRVSGKPFPAHERSGVGYLMMPAGRLGPAFIVTPNFYVLKDYNMSDLYALFVGHAGDRIAYGGGDFAAPWQRVDTMLRSDVAAMQRGLEALGHDVGGADGLAGFRTRRSIGRWQDATGRAATCFPDAQVINALRR